MKIYSVKKNPERCDLHSVNNCALPPSPCIRCCQRSGQFKPARAEYLSKILLLMLFKYIFKSNNIKLELSTVLPLLNADAKSQIKLINDIIDQVKMEELTCLNEGADEKQQRRVTRPSHVLQPHWKTHLHWSLLVSGVTYQKGVSDGTAAWHCTRSGKGSGCCSAESVMLLLEGLRRDARHTVMFDNNIRPISMWSRGGWGPRGAREGVGGIWSGVISEANSPNNWEAELRGDGFLLWV